MQQINQAGIRCKLRRQAGETVRKVQAFEFCFGSFYFSDQKLTYTLANISLYVNDFMQFYVVNIITNIYKR